jgi:bifunctional non-homologous end joining protein LigD
MSLETYRRKRDFKRTPEPAGKKKAAERRQRIYVIQKHDATRLHYDFRLELHGVLLSWAIPKGPSLVPGDKRLAVRVEDHPIDYATFEGVIPEGEYGGGPVLLWDGGTWTPDGDPDRGLERGKLDFTLNGKKLAGGWTLVRLAGRDEKRENWLLIKRRDAASQLRGEIVEQRPESVASGRTIEEIAGDRRSKTWHSNRDRAAAKRPRSLADALTEGRAQAVVGGRKKGGGRKESAGKKKPSPRAPRRARSR